MKRLLTTGLFLMSLSACLLAQSNSYKSFELDIFRIGYVSPSGDIGTTTESYSGGVSFALEPRFNLSDAMSLGLRLQLDVFGSSFDDGTDVSVSRSYVLVADRYFSTTSPNRFFAGVGAGLFESGTVTIGSTNTELEGESSVGIVPRFGYELGHLRLSAEYNYTFKSENPNYFGLHAAITLWGGYKG